MKRFNNVEKLYNQSGADAYVNRNRLWNYFVEELIVGKEANSLGLGVSEKEIQDLFYSPTNPSPVIRQNFPGRQPGQIVDSEQLNVLRQQLKVRPELRVFWKHLEDEVEKSRLQSKLNALVSKALYTPTWMAEMGNKEYNQNMSFTYVRVPFNKVQDNEVDGLETSDYQAFINKNEARFKKEEETRTVKYAVFNVVATKSDSAKLKTEIGGLITEFGQATNDTLFVEQNLELITVLMLPKNN